MEKLKTYYVPLKIYYYVDEIGVGGLYHWKFFKTDMYVDSHTQRRRVINHIRKFSKEHIIGYVEWDGIEMSDDPTVQHFILESRKK